MKTHYLLIGTLTVFAVSPLTASFAFDHSEYLILARHRDSNGNLLVGPTHHHSQAPVVQKTVIPAQPQTFERRSTDWGMNFKEVTFNEPVQPVWELRYPVLEEYEQRVAYRSQIEGIDASLTYTFYEDKLAQANYLFEPGHEDAVNYVQDFHTVMDWITQSYGRPVSVQEIWLDDLYRYDRTLWGQAVLRGHLKMAAEWRSESTQITLLLDGGDDTIGLVADFDSVSIVPPAPTEANVVMGDADDTGHTPEESPAAEVLQPGETDLAPISAHEEMPRAPVSEGSPNNIAL